MYNYGSIFMAEKNVIEIPQIIKYYRNIINKKQHK